LDLCDLCHRHLFHQHQQEELGHQDFVQYLLLHRQKSLQQKNRMHQGLQHRLQETFLRDPLLLLLHHLNQ
jgi:hypothetical protein